MILRRFIFPLFRSIYTVLIIVAAVLSACIWYFAPLIGSEGWHPFDSILARIVTIACLWLFFLLLIGVIFWLRSRKDKEMTEEMAEAVDTSDDGGCLIRGVWRTARQVQDGAGRVAQIQERAAAPERIAVVRDDRPPGGGQDHGNRQFRPAISAG